MLKGNKGEWSEIYTLCKILADGKLYVGDANLIRLADVFYPVIKILRTETHGSFEFSYLNDLVLVNAGGAETRVPIEQFHRYARLLFDQLRSQQDTTFSIPAIEDFMASFGSQSLKAKSSVKSDIRIVIHDSRAGMSPELGFSIKSQLGGLATLLNAGKTTNFVYQLDAPLQDLDVNRINAIESKHKIRDRLAAILEKSRLHFLHAESDIFSNNLQLIDSALPKIIAESLQIFYGAEARLLSEIVSRLHRNNPLEFDLRLGHPFYEYKIKRFLVDVALGMMPGQVWNGQYDSTGGYLVVKENGEVLCYHLYNRNEFEDYLFTHTKLETASSSRHNFGTLYEEDGRQLFKLNLQIRFV